MERDARWKLLKPLSLVGDVLVDECHLKNVFHSTCDTTSRIQRTHLPFRARHAFQTLEELLRRRMRKISRNSQNYFIDKMKLNILYSIHEPLCLVAQHTTQLISVSLRIWRSGLFQHTFHLQRRFHIKNSVFVVVVVDDPFAEKCEWRHWLH